ncbi:hypothetical protein [Candidatus Methanomassiliicoccus intestinalis]|jgi:hypothetical protein|uniref:Uncharacterized protein n=1 Tax=Siphoviridae sp. ctedO8 TaxID=2827907 RepID=A0A8S5T4I8_9CAUD|nr:MAG TPA: hypothetical protein [Siphoviridae sp. ctedO8]
MRVEDLHEPYSADEIVLLDKHKKVLELYFPIFDTLLNRFFDISSLELLDEKLEVLTALSDGKTPAEIPLYDKILELYPVEDLDVDGEIETALWD